MSSFGIGDRFYESKESIPGPGQYGARSGFQEKSRDGLGKRFQNWSPARMRSLQQQLTQSQDQIVDLQRMLDDATKQHQQEKEDLVNLAAQQQVFIEKLEHDIKYSEDIQSQQKSELEVAYQKVEELTEQQISILEYIKRRVGENFNEEHCIYENLENAFQILDEQNEKLTIQLEAKNLAEIESRNISEQQIQSYENQITQYKKQFSDTNDSLQELFKLLDTLYTQIYEKEDILNQQRLQAYTYCDEIVDEFEKFYEKINEKEQKSKFVDQSTVDNSSNSSAEIQKFECSSDEDSNKENLLFNNDCQKGRGGFFRNNKNKQQFVQYHLKLKHELEELRHQCTKLLRDKIVLERRLSP